MAGNSVHEITTRIKQLESSCNDLDQAPAMELMGLRRRRAMMIRDVSGCCGESYSIDVQKVNSHGVVFETYTVVKCRYTGQRCEAANARQVFDLFSLLNSGEP